MPDDPTDALPTSRTPIGDAIRAKAFIRGQVVAACQFSPTIRDPEEWALDRLRAFEQEVIRELAAGGDAAIRRAIADFGLFCGNEGRRTDPESSDEYVSRSEEIGAACDALMTKIAAQRAAEAARVRDAALEEAAQVLDRAHVMKASPEPHELGDYINYALRELAQAIRALREAPRVP